MPDALQMLKEDHRKVQDLFKEFDDAESPSERKRIVTQAIQELEIHAQLEEEIFYPAVWDEAEPDDETMEEAEEEHHVAKTIMGELKRMQPSASNYEAKFKVLAENVKHHIQEEESLMLPKAAELGGERMGELGAEMAERKMQLMTGVTSRNGRTSTRRTTTRGRTGARRTTRTRATTSRRTTRRTTRATGATASRSRTTRGTRTTASRNGRGRATGTRTVTRGRTTATGRARRAASARTRAATTRSRRTTATSRPRTRATVSRTTRRRR